MELKAAIQPGVGWINAPTEGSTYLAQSKPQYGRRIHISAAGNLYLMVAGSTTAGVLMKAVAVGDVIDQIHEGIGTDTTATVECVQF
jgi:hypothetical protein